MIQGAAFRILYCYAKDDVLGFAYLCKEAGYPTDLGGYYIRQLIQGGYLTKADRGQYAITPKGKQELAVSYGKQQNFRRPRAAVLLVVQSGDAFVVLERKVQPFIGRTEWPAGSVQAGEAMPDASKRLLRERLGLEGQPLFVGFFRRIDMFDTSVFDDKLFAVHTYNLEPDVSFMQEGATGLNILCTEKELQSLKRPAKSLLDILQFAQDESTSFEEHIYKLSEADLSLSD